MKEPQDLFQGLKVKTHVLMFEVRAKLTGAVSAL